MAAAARRLLGRVGRDAGIERLAGAHGLIERPHRLLERGLGIEAVRVEDVDIVDAHAAQALVEAGEQVFARAPFAVRPRPHQVAGLGRHDQLVAMAAQIGRAHPAEALLGRARRRAVIVGEVEMGDAQVERPAQHRPAVSNGAGVAEIVPQPEGESPAA